MGLLSHEKPVAHQVEKGNPEIDGPYLDDYNENYLDARRNLELPGQDIQDENYDPKVDRADTELGDGGTVEKVIAETPTTKTTLKTVSKLDKPKPVAKKSAAKKAKK
jgi:hypothetical protein